MSYNLTSKQRDALKWVVEEVLAGNFGESFTIGWGEEGRIIDGEEEFWWGDSSPKFDMGTLEAWDRSGLVIVTAIDPDPVFHTGPRSRCTLTQLAYDAVAADFVQLDRIPNTKRLMGVLSRNFSFNELRNVASMLGIQHESIEGGNLEVYARELIAYCQRRNLVWELVSVALALE